MLCVPIALLFVVGTSAPAHAVSYNLEAQSGNGGAGEVFGTLNFNSKKQFDYNALVRDICPGDYLGVSFRFSVTYVFGAGFNTSYRGQDTNGCGPNASGPFVNNVNSPNNIDYVNVVMCFTDNGDPCHHVGEVSSDKNNPYT